MRKIIIVIVMLLGIFSLYRICGTSWGDELVMPGSYYKLSTNVVTPHISWAKPLYRGKIKALVLAPRWSQRETVELMERLDINCVTFFSYTADSLWLGGWNWGFENIKALQQKETLARLESILDAQYDVIIMGWVPAKDFPADVVEKIKEKVKNGTGLVYTFPSYYSNPELTKALTATPSSDAGSYIFTGIPFESLPGFGVRDREKDLPKIVSLYQYGKGRVAFVNYVGGPVEGFLTPGDADDLNFEYYQSFIIKTILWSVNREPPVSIKTFPAAISGTQGKIDPLSFQVTNKGVSGDCTISLSIRSGQPLWRMPAVPTASPGVQQTDPLIQPVYQDTKEQSFALGDSTVQFTIPSFPSGTYYADVDISIKEGGKITWASTVLTVKSAMDITEIKTSPEYVDLKSPGPQVTALVSLSAAAPKGTGLNLALLDNNDRLLSVKEVQVKEGESTIPVVFQVPADMFSTLGKIRTELKLGGSTAAVKTGYFTVINRGWNDFTFFAWGGVGRDYIGRQRARIIAQLGVDAFRGGDSISALQVADVRCIADVLRLTTSISDPQPRMETAESVTETVKSVRPFDPFGFLYGDEFGCQTNPSHLANYREYLKQKYRTIDNLNAQWGFHYASFDTVLDEPYGPAADVDKAKVANNYSYMVDQWLYKFFIFADTVRFLGETIKEINPSYKVGGSTPLWNFWYRRYDWADIMPYFDIFTPYYGPGGSSDSHYEIGRSFAKPGTVLSGHYGSYSNTMTIEPYYNFIPWSLLLHGASNAFWYNAIGRGEESGISPWLDPYPCLQRSSDEINAIKNGPGTLFLGAKRISDGIAIHYSPANLIYSSIVSGPWVSWNYNGIISTIQDMGFQADFVSDEQIRNGKLSEYKILFLPISQCIGQQEAQKMKEFVENGGLLIANVRPGVADDHGKVGNQKIIPQLFGVQWKNVMQPLGLMNVRLSGSYKGKTFSGPESEEINPDTAMYLDGAQAVLTANGTPLFTYKDSGKGTAICLNTQAYPVWPSAPNALTELLAAHNIESAFRIINTQEKYNPGKWIPGFDSVRFSDGKALYFGITREGHQNDDDKVVGTFTLTFPEKGHLYDMRNKQYLGYVDSWKTDIGPYGVEIYSFLPYKVGGIDIKTGKQEYSRGEMVTGDVSVNTGGSPAVRHVINLSVTRPDNLEVSYLKQNLQTAAGKTSFQFPLALNEPAGAWQLKFTDAATGVSGSFAVNVH